MIEQLFNEGRRFSLPVFMIHYILCEGEKPELRFGVGVSSKNFKKAVDRNRMKRLMRESWRLQKNDLLQKIISTNQQLNVFIIYTGKELPLYKDLFAMMTKVVGKLERIQGIKK